MKKVLKSIKDFIFDDLLFLIVLLIIYLILTWPVNYYITVGGGVSDISSRINVEDSNKIKGSYNISYVTELKGTVTTYLLSYLFSDWRRVNADLYKYDANESISDIDFRSDLDLSVANGTATRWAYTLAHKEYEEISSKIFITGTFTDTPNPLKIKDEILSINGRTFSDVEDYRKYMQGLNTNQELLVKVKRDGKEKELKCKLYEEDGRKILGVILGVEKKYKTNPKVKIKFNKSESGTSGGLITTLYMYDALTKKDLTKGLKIAGTGTIEEDGTIGAIGGVKYKLIGAIKDKCDVFLVPSGKDYDECREYLKKHKSNIKLIEVKTIQGAIESLGGLK